MAKKIKRKSKRTPTYLGGGPFNPLDPNAKSPYEMLLPSIYNALHPQFQQPLLDNPLAFDPNDYPLDFSDLPQPTLSNTDTSPLTNQIQQQNNTAGIDFKKNPLDGSRTSITRTGFNPYESLVNIFDFALNSAAAMKNKKTQRDNFQPQQPNTSYFNDRALRGDKVMFAKKGGEYQEGGEYELSDKEIERLKKLGYEFDII